MQALLHTITMVNLIMWVCLRKTVKNKNICMQSDPDIAPPVYCHPCIASTRTSEQKLNMYFQKESPGETPPSVAAVHQHLC